MFSSTVINLISRNDGLLGELSVCRVTDWIINICINYAN